MKNHLNQAAQMFGSLAKKVMESAVHALVFSVVSKKVSDFLDTQKEKTCSKDKCRVEDNSVPSNSSPAQLKQ